MRRRRPAGDDDAAVAEAAAAAVAAAVNAAAAASAAPALPRGRRGSQRAVLVGVPAAVRLLFHIVFSKSLYLAC